MAIETDLIERTMHLPEKDRAELARQLLLSLQPAQADPDYEREWEVEIERRLGEIDRGEVELIDSHDAISRGIRSLRPAAQLLA